MDIVKIPLEAVSTRKYIEWQCDGSKGMTLNRLAEVCGCFSGVQESYGCHHPKLGDQCLAHECPIAYIDYPEDASEEECDRYAEGYGDEIRMVLASEDDAGKGQNFGEGGFAAWDHWYREQRFADDMVERLLEGQPAFVTLPPDTQLKLHIKDTDEMRYLTFGQLMTEYVDDLNQTEVRNIQEALSDTFGLGTYIVGGATHPKGRVSLAGSRG